MDMIKSITVHMDYVGRAVKLYQIIILLFGVVGLFWGYTIQQFSQTVYILGEGWSWPASSPSHPGVSSGTQHSFLGYKMSIFQCRSKPVKWQEARPENDASDGKIKEEKVKSPVFILF
jgi:hypothetical protein